MDHSIGKDIRKDEEEIQYENREKHATLDNIRNDTNTMGELDNLDVDAREYVVKNVKTKIEPLVKHDGEFFYCDQCDYQTGRKGDVRKHQQYKHEDVRYAYACGQCDYQPKDRSSLRKHQRAIHEGIRYPCISVIIKQEDNKASVNTKKTNIPAV